MRLKEFAHGFDLANIQRDCKKEALRFFPSGGTGVNAARETLRSRSPHAVWFHSIDYCEQTIDGATQHRPKRRVAFNAVRLPIRRIVGQYGDVARAALCAFERDGSIFARDRLVVP